MSAVIGQVFQAPLRAGKKESVDLIMRAVTSTSNGVIDQTLSTYSDPACSIVRSGTGTYNVTFPVCPADVNIQGNIVTPLANTVSRLHITAFSPTAGTATLATSTAAADTTAADNANAVFEIHLRLVGVMRAGN